MKAEFYHRSSSRPIFSLDVSTTEDEEGRIFEAEIEREILKLQAHSQLGWFLPSNGQERNPVSINEFIIRINDEIFIPQEEIKIYFYRDKIEIPEGVMLEPEEQPEEID